MPTDNSKSKLIKVFLLFSLVAGSTATAAWMGVHLVRPKQGKLVAPQSEIVWESPAQNERIGLLRANVEFPLVNSGNAPIKILSVDSTCGCTLPQMSISTIPPGGNATLTAVGTPVDSGERSVTITVQTDSALTPSLPLKLKMISRRTPPFVVAISGDFGYVSESDFKEDRDLTVITTELAVQNQVPIIECDLPFLEFLPPTFSEVLSEPNNIAQRKYTYKVHFKETSGSASFSGKIWVIDPWTRARDKSLIAFYRNKSSVIVTPSRLVLEKRSDTNMLNGYFIVTLPAEQDNLIIDVEKDDDHTVKVEEVSANRKGRFRKFLVKYTGPGRVDAKYVKVVLRSQIEQSQLANVSIIVPGQK